MIALISSIPDEGKKIVREIKNLRVFVSPQLRVIRGQIYNKDVVYAASGIGKTNAAHAATILLEKYSPELIILFGIGGAYPSSGLSVGDIAVAEKEIYGDEGVLTREGFQGTDIIGIPLLKKGRREYFNEFPLDKKLVKATMNVIPPRPPLVKGGWGDFQVKSGTFVTVSTCTGTRKRAIELRNRYNAICENMEGAAVAHVCAMYGTPMLETRGISNPVEDRDKGKWNIKIAAENCQKTLIEMLRYL